MSTPTAPLDAGGLDAVLAEAAALKAALPHGSGIEPQVWSDFRRLSWMAHYVPLSELAPPDEWVVRARESLERTIGTLRSWPAALGTGGPAEEAELLAGITDDELRTLAPRVEEVGECLRLVFQKEGPAPDELQPEDPEARKWLRQKTVRTALAGNRFAGRDEALAFVEALYAAGAERVVIASETIRKDGPKDRYADALRLVLPADPGKRASLFAMVDAESAEDGYDPEEDTGQRVVFLWWD